MYFHTDNADTIESLQLALTVAVQQEKRIRFDVGSDGSLKYKIGEGMWSAPIRSTPDPYRDAPATMTCNASHGYGCTPKDH